MARAFLATVSGLVLLGGLVLSLSYSGFCFQQRQFRTEADHINAVVDRIIAQSSHQLVTREAGLVRFSSVSVVPYRSRDEFFEKNPDCCRTFASYVGDEFVPPTFLQKLTGRAAANVSVTYAINYFDDKSVRQQAIATSRMTVTNCGLPVRNY